jgi:tight adherence protein C
MTMVVLAAVGSGLGVIGIFLGMHPASPTLRAALIQLESQPENALERTAVVRRRERGRVDARLAAKLAAAASEQTFVRQRVWPLLRVTGTSIQDLCREVLLGAGAGLVLPGVWWIVLTAGGVHLPFTVPVWSGLALSGCGGLLPFLVLHARAGQARRSARRVVGRFLNLVVLCLAGGMGIEGALHASARIGEDEVSEKILNALVLAQDAGEPPWDALDDLGRSVGISELTELAAAVGLAGAEGARIRMTLTSKAQSIRRHDLAEDETRANSVTERLFLPGIFLLVGFLLFIAYPAVARISSGL